MNYQVGSVKAAERAIAAGVDCIIAQGVEAGGHIAGTVSHHSLSLSLSLSSFFLLSYCC